MPIIAMDYQACTSATALALARLASEAAADPTRRPLFRYNGEILLAAWRSCYPLSFEHDDAIMLAHLLERVGGAKGVIADKAIAPPHVKGSRPLRAGELARIRAQVAGLFLPSRPHE